MCFNLLEYIYYLHIYLDKLNSIQKEKSKVRNRSFTFSTLNNLFNFITYYKFEDVPNGWVPTHDWVRQQCNCGGCAVCYWGFLTEDKTQTLKWDEYIYHIFSTQISSVIIKNQKHSLTYILPFSLTLLVHGLALGLLDILGFNWFVIC